MSKRPYLEKSIDELIQIFDSSSSDGDVLLQLEKELQFRSTKKAKRLQNKVRLALGDNTPQVSDAEHAETVTAKLRPNSKVKEKAKRLAPKAEEAAPKIESARAVEPVISSVKVTSKPEITNNPRDILRAWTALEVLSPQSFRRETDLVGLDKNRLDKFSNGIMPWDGEVKSRPKKRLYFELILGTIAVGPAVEKLLEVYADDRPEKQSAKGYCPIASIILDKEGRPLEEPNSIAVSSFAWGIPIAMQGNLKALADWPEQEKSLIKNLRSSAIKRDKNNEIIALTAGHVQALYKKLEALLALSGQEIEAPYFCIRHYEWYGSKKPAEPSLINSFFMEDLCRARELDVQGCLPQALKHYLGAAKPQKQIDLLKDDLGLIKLLQPALTPLGRWPGRGRHPLALLQQAAVNSTHSKERNTNVVAVNGPPGTGKTTLLRDIVAARIIERAAVMSEYDRPASAFTATSQKLTRQGAKITLHHLDERLKGFEMVVASSNNKAVENVSAELPTIDAIADDIPNLRYFKTISDKLIDSDSWGLIAGVLGNAKNRYDFAQAFWRDEEDGLSTYLNHVSGVPQVVTDPQENGPPITRNRRIVDTEAPPSNAAQAEQNWTEARYEFLQAKNTAEKAMASLQQVHTSLLKFYQAIKRAEELYKRKQLIKSELEDFRKIKLELGSKLEVSEKELKARQNLETNHLAKRPGWLQRLFRTKPFRSWQTENRSLREALEECRAATKAVEAQLQECASLVTGKQHQINTIEREYTEVANEKAELEDSIQRQKDLLGIILPDPEFLSSPHVEKQVASLWLTDAQQRLRDRVFETAILLHRAFIDASADPLRQNLHIFTETFGTSGLGTSEKDALIPDLWATFFLVVPVISTTFASVNRMFSRLPPESLGWLMVDEAGQALPQAVVGAMLRTQNSVVVGDPLQIEPVVTLPESLTTEICSFFGVDALTYNAPIASVQTLADMASSYCAEFPSGSGYRSVGAPLLVHRRCDSPMFEMSNEMAYSNLMVHAKAPSGYCSPLGASHWIDVAGAPRSDKWCPDEAKVLIQLLEQVRTTGDELDCYIVTPFVIVQDNLRSELIKSSILEGWVDNPREWVNEHVGTVHTVQGREAKMVFFVLGAQNPTQGPARNWAGSRPNLANVAVTRAKAFLYVIGNRKLWKSAGFFSSLDRLL